MKKADAIIVLLLLSLGSAPTVYPISPAHAQSPTFKMAGNPSSLTFPTGSFETSNITITSLYGLTGTISLSGESFPYQQVSVTLNATSVYLPPYGVAYALANVSASSTTTPYNYTIDVNGSGPGGYETAFLFALVTPGPATIPDFRLSANPDYLSAAPGTVHNVTVSVASLDGFVGDVSLRVFYPPSRLNASLVHLNAGSILNLTLTIPTSCPVYPPQGPGSSQVDANSTSLHHWLDVYILVATSPPSFCFTANPRLVGAVAGSSAETQFVAIGLGGFNNTVVLSAQSSFQVTFLPGNLSGLARTNPQLFNILVYVPPSTAVGNQTVVVRGTSGAVSWSDNLTVMVTIGPYYSVSTNPGSLTIPEGSSGAATISLTGESGFTRNDVGASLPIASPVGLSAKMDPGRYATPYGFYVYNGYTTTLSVTVNASVASPGAYTLFIPLNTVYSPYVENYAIFQVSVISPGPDFSISANPTSLAVQAGGTATSTLTLTSLNGFTGTVSLTSNSSLAVLSPAIVTLSAGGTNTSTMTFASRSDTLPGKLVITVSAGGSSWYAMITVLVSSPSSSSILGLPPVEFYLVLGASIAALAVAVSLVIVRTRRTKGPKGSDGIFSQAPPVN